MKTLTGNEIEYKGYTIFNYLRNGSNTFAVEGASFTVEYPTVEEAVAFIDEHLEGQADESA